MKLPSVYHVSLLVFLTAATKGFAQETETLLTPTTTPIQIPSEKPEEAYEYDVPEQQYPHPKQQQQQAPGAVHHSFVRQPSPIPADERRVDVEVEVGVDVDVGAEAEAEAMLPEQQQQRHLSQYPDTHADTDSEKSLQPDLADDMNVEIPESNANVDESLHLHHVEVDVEPEPEQEDGNQEPEEELDTAEEAPTLIPTTETLAMNESVHRDYPPVGRDYVAEASEPDDVFCQQQQQPQQQQDPAAELDVEQLKLLLQQHHALDSDADIPEDDRTLLDIFGEVTKEYLTQNVVRLLLLLFDRSHLGVTLVSQCSRYCVHSFVWYVRSV
jgi:hypothetical protein